MPLASDPDTPALPRHAAEAEEVRLYLVTLRGGAPFLSGRDGRILLEWLENGWSVAQITAVMDQVAVDRTKKRIRSRMTLSACKSHLEKQTAKKQSKSRTGRLHVKNTGLEQGTAPLGELIEQISKLSCETDEKPLLKQLCASLAQAETEGDIDTTARAAVQAVRAFFEQLWIVRMDQHEGLRASAEARLAPLKGVVKGKNFTDLVEEGARQQLRARFDLVSAQTVWDTLFPGSS